MKKYITTDLMIYLLFFYVFIFSTNLFAQEKIELALAECIKMALDNSRNFPVASSNKIGKYFDRIFKSQSEEKEKNRRNNDKTVYKIKTLYYDLLLAKELIQLADEVKSNFEKAYEKAEKKLESEDPDITLQDVLKLKLGLVGSKDELNRLEHDKKEIIESLKYKLGIPGNKIFEIKSKRLKQEKIDLKKVEGNIDLTLSNKSSFKEKEDIFRITKVFLKINKANDSIKTAREARKVSRGLLVINLANFDFGIGEAKDLFEALFIYMRSVKNYLTKIHEYNIAVAELSYETGKDSSNWAY
ncbi:MAG: TolC family protein [Nitrospinota bacterium]